MLDNLKEALRVMGIGMSGIFLVIGVIYIAIKLLIRFFPPKTEE